MLKNYREIITTYVTENICKVCKENNINEGTILESCENCVLMKCVKRMNIEHKLLIAVSYILGIVAIIGLFGIKKSIQVSFSAMFITIIWAFIIYLVYVCVYLIRDLFLTKKSTMVSRETEIEKGIEENEPPRHAKS